MTDCPAEEQLAGFAEGVCSDEEARRIEAHLDHCSRCTEWLERARGYADQVARIAAQEVTHSHTDTAWQGQGGAPTPHVATSTHLSQSIEGYTIVREIHRGGQGVVYQAVQLSTKRKVAIKVLVSGAHASKTAQKRFEREIELVAQLTHPNIIAIFDSGRTREDLPYYAMDYVRGLTLKQYVRENQLALEDTLRLFSKACEAVQYAHHKGVIHRDLKPSNILVDTEGHPKILDFGLAKLLASPVHTLVSISEEVIGTLPYMSPEQARGQPDEVDTRTDIYSLGVVLYELLTGHYPYPVVGQMGEVLRNIAETPPTPPSRKWTTQSGVTRMTARHLRAGECPIDDEVQTIILKALSKERDRRYQSAGEFARDIGHYLSGEPIEARGDSGWYLFRKTVRRHRVPLFAGALFLLVLIVSLCVSVASWHEAVKERDAAQAYKEFVTDMLAWKGSDVTIRNLLDDSSLNIGKRFGDQPLVEASLQATIGSFYRALGEYDIAEPHIKRGLELHERLLGNTHPDTLASMTSMAQMFEMRNRYDEAEKLYTQVLGTRRDVLGPQHPDTLSSVNDLARLRFRQKRYDDAEQLFKQCLADRRRALGPNHPDTLTSMNNLANLYWQQERYDSAEALYKQTLDARNDHLGAAHPQTLKSAINLATVYYVTQRYEPAEALLVPARERCQRVLGDAHPDTLNCMNILARNYAQQGRYEQAEALDRQVWQTRNRTLGREHPSTLKSMLNLGLLSARREDWNEARSYYIQVREIAKQALGIDDPITLEAMLRLAEAYQRQTLYPQAEDELLEAYRNFTQAVNGDPQMRSRILQAIVGLYEQWGQPAKVMHWRARLALENLPAGQGHSGDP